MNKKPPHIIIWEGKVVERILKERPNTISAPEGLDLRMLGYRRSGSNRPGVRRWEEISWSRARKKDYRKRIKEKTEEELEE